ncbi:hypothetical protein HYDPIDRAFT_31199 [Hydnomerulius pinastri MD-312]|uniref:Uncharacterized protein n=1 Tax=Hydnomerulius pinastri MD-312 TaxID=994086 RepID=A0A0C9V7F6_9AGAM|nr:hypothetical protein HYDPIDRAFT_31199 [Hydnomerulius pinastri MD-312]
MSSSSLPSTPTTSPSPTTTSDTSSEPTITSANYFFGFIITFVVLLLLFVGCGVGSRRRFAFIRTAWDDRLLAQDEDDRGVLGERRRRGRGRRLVHPVFWETWVYPGLAKGGGAVSWETVQPISAAFVRSPVSTSGDRTKTIPGTGDVAPGPSHNSTPASPPPPPPPPSQSQSPPQNISTSLNYLFRRPRPRRTSSPPKPPPPDRRPPPEAVQVAMIICMPSPSSTRNEPREGAGGQTVLLGEYQIGITQVPWGSGDIS